MMFNLDSIPAFEFYDEDTFVDSPPPANTPKSPQEEEEYEEKGEPEFRLLEEYVRDTFPSLRQGMLPRQVEEAPTIRQAPLAYAPQNIPIAPVVQALVPHFDPPPYPPPGYEPKPAQLLPKAKVEESSVPSFDDFDVQLSAVLEEMEQVKQALVVSAPNLQPIPEPILKQNLQKLLPEEEVALFKDDTFLLRASPDGTESSVSRQASVPLNIDSNYTYRNGNVHPMWETNNVWQANTQTWLESTQLLENYGKPIFYNNPYCQAPPSLFSDPLEDFGNNVFDTTNVQPLESDSTRQFKRSRGEYDYDAYNQNDPFGYFGAPTEYGIVNPTEQPSSFMDDFYESYRENKRSKWLNG